jgi:hypothetical protein
MIDRVFAPVLDGNLFAAQPWSRAAYEFSVEPNGVIRDECPHGESRVELIPGDRLKTADGSFRKITVRASLCTEFGFKTRETSLYVPSELLEADSDVIQGAWETRTYTGVPSAKDPDHTMTLQVRRVSGDQLEIVSVPQGLEEPAFQPVLLSLSQPEEMLLVQNWRSGLLPVKEVRFQVDTDFLSKPVVVRGKLARIRPASRI